MPDRLPSIRETLKAHGQDHLLAFYDELDPEAQEGLLDQLQAIDFDAVDGWIDAFVKGEPAFELPSDLEPAPFYPRDPGDAYDAADYRSMGLELIRAGKVAVFCVAGGQGTRLGWSGPKGTFPGTAVTGKPLFRLLAEQVRAHRNRHGVTIPFYIMTSPLNDAATRAFIQDNNCFGLNRRDIFMFPQGLLPSLDARTGKLLLADKGAVAMNPDGHGGSITALAASGAIEDMTARGIEHISYVQVDNPLVKVLDPLFLGLHAAAPDSSAEMSSKVVLKTDPLERVGVLCRTGGKTIVVEYTHLPERLATEHDAAGNLRFNAGSIAVHILGVEFVRRLTAGAAGLALPLHPAHKSVEHVDPESGRRVVPEAPNAVKLETFVFDALPLAKSSIVFETGRTEEFAPIKNARDVDSPQTSHQLQSDRAGTWLEAHGVKIPRDDAGRVAARIELSPLTALEPQDLARVKLPESIEPGASIVL
ncbi:MAG: UTP--glucose-1-phosphate uridylyltransferase [Planctomycetota bacterium]|jgi:UDP-N-acetylglucosamine/UDP-N-acetylgalactosamine diphosphorylase